MDGARSLRLQGVLLGRERGAGPPRGSAGRTRWCYYRTMGHQKEDDQPAPGTPDPSATAQSPPAPIPHSHPTPLSSGIAFAVTSVATACRLVRVEGPLLLAAASFALPLLLATPLHRCSERRPANALGDPVGAGAVRAHQRLAVTEARFVQRLARGLAAIEPRAHGPRPGRRGCRRAVRVAPRTAGRSRPAEALGVAIGLAFCLVLPPSPRRLSCRIANASLSYSRLLLGWGRGPEFSGCVVG